MLNKLKKGFTIVELVIVIAVIAILAGVLIPTFSSITKNAKQSAAMQQARNAMEATLALTGGAYPTGTDFVVDDGKDGKLDYWFSYEGNALQDVTKDTTKAKADFYHKEYVTGETVDLAKSYYAAYFSSKCFNDAVTAKDKSDTVLGDSTLYLRSEALLLEALGLPAGATVLDFTSVAAGGYVTLKHTATEGGAVTTIRLYYTADIEPTLVIILGNN